MKTVKCVTCGEVTSNSLGQCDSCRSAATARERAEQGLPPKITDSPEAAAWIARLLLPRKRVA